MNNRFIILICFLFLSISIFAQSPATVPASKRYLVDFEVKGTQTTDRQQLDKIDVTKFDALRKQNERYEYLDNNSGLTIILYSWQECAVISGPPANTTTNPKERFQK